MVVWCGHCFYYRTQINTCMMCMRSQGGANSQPIQCHANCGMHTTFPPLSQSSLPRTHPNADTPTQHQTPKHTPAALPMCHSAFGFHPPASAPAEWLRQRECSAVPAPAPTTFGGRPLHVLHHMRPVFFVFLFICSKDTSSK